MSNLDRAIHLSNQLYDLILDSLDTAEGYMERIGKNHPKYARSSRNRDALLEISELLDTVDTRLHDLYCEEED